MSGVYHKEIEQINIDKMNDIISAFPKVAIPFFKAKSEQLAASTRLGYAEDLYVFFDYLVKKNPMCKDIESIPEDVIINQTPGDLDEFMEYLGHYELGGKEYSNSHTTKARKLATLRSFYKFLIQRGITDKNPATVVENPKIVKKEIVTLETGDKKRFMDVAITGEGLSDKAKQFHETLCSRDKAIIYVLLGTGIRVSELVGLDMDDVNTGAHRLTVIRKGGSEDHVYFNNEVMAALNEYIETERPLYDPKDGSDAANALFLSRKKQRLTVRSVEYLIKKYANVSLGTGNHITPHKMRSTFATQSVNEGGDIYATSKALGHTSISTTAKYYTKVTEESKKKASQIEVYPFDEQT